MKSTSVPGGDTLRCFLYQVPDERQYYMSQYYVDVYVNFHINL